MIHLSLGGHNNHLEDDRVKKLEHKVKSKQPRRRARVVISDTKEDLEDPSKQGRRIAKINQNPSISLPTELVEDLGSGEKGEKEISTANISVSTASTTPKVSTAAENLVYIRRSVEKRINKEKAIMKEDESVQKKAKKQLEQERLEHEEAIRLQEQINEEERQRIARDAEIAKQYHALQNNSSAVAEVRKNMCMYLKNQRRYKQSHFKGMSYEDIRLIFERVWDQNHAFVPKDSEIKKEARCDGSTQTGTRKVYKVATSEVEECLEESSQKGSTDIMDVTGLNLTVSYPNGTVEHVKQIRSYKLGNNLIIKDVLVVPEYHISFLFVHKLSRDNKVIVSFNGSKCKIQDLTQKFLMGTGSERGLYFFDDGRRINNSNIKSFNVSTCIWHNRLRHPSDQMLSVLKNRIEDLSQSESGPCEICHKVKQTREHFPISDHKSSSLSDLVHLDVWGPYRVKSREGFRFFLTVVDDYTRAVWVFLMQSKMEVFEHIKTDSSNTTGLSCSTSRSKDTEDTRYATKTGVSKGIPGTLRDNDYDYEGEYIEYFGQLFESPKPTVCQNIKRSSIKTSMPSKYSDYVLNKNVKYGIDKFVNYANLSIENFVFTTSLNKIMNHLLMLKLSKTTDGKSCTELLTEFGMLACKPCNTPIEVNPDNKKIISRYLKRTPRLGITFKESDNTDLKVFVDFDWAKCKNTRRSITGYVVFLGNNLVSWKSKKQVVVPRSCTKAEYKGIYKIAATPILHERSKNSEIDLYFLRKNISAGFIITKKVKSEENMVKG
ncbi:ribonuclease H-like domain-containing protein [Tanacetum coccineum]